MNDLVCHKRRTVSPPRHGLVASIQIPSRLLLNIGSEWLYRQGDSAVSPVKRRASVATERIGPGSRRRDAGRRRAERGWGLLRVVGAAVDQAVDEERDTDHDEEPADADGD